MFLSNGQTVSATFVSTLADSTPVWANGNYYGSNGLGLLNTYAAYGAIYKTQLWVGIVVRKLAMATARMPFEVKRRLNETDSVAEAGPLAQLMARPNDEMSGFDLWEWTSSTRDVYGEAFWWKIRGDSGRVRKLQPILPTNIAVQRLADGSLGYLLMSAPGGGADGLLIPAADMVAFKSYNPDTLARGHSTLEGLRMTLLNEDAARRATAAMWANGARPSMILTTEQSLTDRATERLQKQAALVHGGADNVGKIAVYEEGITPKIVQLSAEEMQYIESRKLNREEVCAAFDVPPPVVHILDHATFSNITEQLRSQYRDTMAPRFVNFEAVIDHQLVPDFYPDRDVFTRFNMEEVLRGDFETKATATALLRNNGVASGNEVRAMFGLPKSDDPYMDRVFANAALVPLGSAEEQVRITATGAADEGVPVELRPAEESALPPGSPPPLALPAAPSKTVSRARQWLGLTGRLKQDGATAKAWQTAVDCRVHTSVDGETVPLDGLFSNGSRVPGEDGVPCGCALEFIQE